MLDKRNSLLTRPAWRPAQQTEESGDAAKENPITGTSPAAVRANLATHRLGVFEHNVRRRESSDGTDPRLKYQTPSGAYGDYQMGPAARKDAGFDPTKALSKDEQRAAFLNYLDKLHLYTRSALKGAQEEEDRAHADRPKD